MKYYKDIGVLFIGGVMSVEEQENEIKSCDGGVDVAANTFSWNLIKAIENFMGISVEIIGDKYVPCYPINNKKIYTKHKWRHGCDSKKVNIQVGFLNHNKYLRIFSKLINISINVIRWVLKNKNEKFLIVYSMHTPYLMSAVIGKIFNRNIKLVLVVPDLPEFMQADGNFTGIKKYLKKLDVALLYKLIRKVDSFILIAESMAEKLKVSKEKYTVIEGLVDINESKEPNNYIERHNMILYTGTLDRRYGVMDLVESFHMLNNDEYNLVICGDGDCRDEIIKICEVHDNIFWLGQIERKRVLELQRQAKILVNPRKNDVYTRYSFPSKTLEYLLSGTPVVMRKLEGVPKEYDDYILYDTDESIESLASLLNIICGKSDSEINNIGNRGKSFVEENKSIFNQAEKLNKCFKVIS